MEVDMPHHETGAGHRGRSLVHDGAVLVDVRASQEYRRGHVPGAVNIPLSDLGRRVGELGEPGARPVVVYCKTGGRSAAARTFLRKRGWQVYDAGALRDW